MDDNDALDNFSVNVRRDPVYNTPVFQTVAGQSSCPAEDNTLARDEMYFQISNPEVTVGANEDAVFNFELGNLSVDVNPRTYNLTFDQASNPYGAMISVGGIPLGFSPIPYAIDQMDVVNVTVNVKRNTANNTFTYEGLRFYLTDACTGDIYKTGTVTARFQTACSPVSLLSPEENWLSNSADNNLVAIQFNDYQIPNLQQITMEFCKVGSNNWQIGFSRLATELGTGANGTQVNWNTSAVADGPYYIRLKLSCASGIIYSQRIMGRIDRTAPVLFGVPQPSDGVYSLGDELSFTYNEQLDVVGLTSANAELIRMSDTTALPFSIGGFENKVKLIPTFNPSAYSGETLRMIVKNIADSQGNIKSSPDTLDFVVGSFNPATGNKAVQLTLNQPTIIENAVDTLFYRFDLPQNAQNDVQVNFTIGGTATTDSVDYTWSFLHPNNLNSLSGTEGRIVIPKGMKHSILRIFPKADGLVESNETVILLLTEGGDYQIGASYSATGTIIDNSIAGPTISGANQFCPGSTTVLTANHPHAGNSGYSILWSNGATTQSITVSQAGTYSVAITQTSSGLTGTSQAFVLTNYALPNTQAGNDFSLSQNSGNFPLGGSPTGGTWSGTGITGNIFNSNQAIGTYPLVYCFTSVDGCTKCDTVLVTITAAPLPSVANPTFSPGAGTFASPITVTLSCATAGAQIYYTTTGNTPVVGTGFTLLYQGPIQVNQTTNIKAISVLAGAPNSAVVSGVFTINNQTVVATPAISPATGTYSGSKLVTISNATSGAEIYYTTSGNLPVIGTSFTKLYTGAFWLTSSATVRAIGVKSGMTNSAIAVSYITITSQGGLLPEPVSIYPAPGEFPQAQTVELNYSDPTVTIYYTLDGTEPDPNSPNTFVYTGPFVISNSATVVAVAMKNGVLQGLLDPAVFTIGVVTSTVENQKVDEVLVYPNPSATGVFQVRSGNGGFDPIRYQVTSLDGKILQDGRLESKESQINLSHLSAGIYLLRILENEQATIRRLIRQ